ncbi:MAG TPA: galactose-1-phosphate uridylyltransferase [Acidimicrobiales bacterium]
MRRAVTKLADGRELIYYSRGDEEPGPFPVDSRTLPPRPPGSEIRHDPVLDEWVAIATHRQSRAVLPPSDECPLCPSTADRATEIPAEDYEVVVFENRSPAFSHQHGRCEVVCFTSEHRASFADLTPGRVRLIVDTWADRTDELSRLPGVEQVFCFENRGEEIGVTLHHPHGQIHAFPFVAPRTRQMVQAAERYEERTGRNVFEDVLAAERSAGTRVVAANEQWTAFVPPFARWPFEVHVYPHRRTTSIVELSETERDAFGPVYLDVLRRLDGVYEMKMPYVAAWHQAPVATGQDQLHLHLQLFSNRRAAEKLKHPAGTEAAMGVFLNDVDPDHAAALLRGAASL